MEYLAGMGNNSFLGLSRVAQNNYKGCRVVTDSHPLCMVGHLLSLFHLTARMRQHQSKYQSLLPRKFMATKHQVPVNSCSSLKKVLCRGIRIHISKALILVQQNQPSSPMPTIELRVGIHCDKCKKEIKRALRRLEGIETYKMDTVLQKMTITGDVTAKEVIKTLVKSGKPACNWDDYPATK